MPQEIIVADVLQSGQDLETTLEPLFYFFKQKRRGAESFGDFTSRVGFASLREYSQEYVPAGTLSTLPQVCREATTQSFQTNQLSTLVVNWPSCSKDPRRAGLHGLHDAVRMPRRRMHIVQGPVGFNL